VRKRGEPKLQRVKKRSGEREREKERERERRRRKEKEKKIKGGAKDIKACMNLKNLKIYMIKR